MAVYFSNDVVLVVDDDPQQRQLFREIISSAGFVVREAADGVEALHAIENSPPDVVVLDLLLPTLDGLSVQQEIAGNSATKHIPVVIVTGSSRQVPWVPGVVLLKPVSPERLVSAIREALQRRRTLP
jgi:CheY-like chemotaxis protein